MTSRRRKIQWVAVPAAVLSLALLTSCKGFFVNQPTAITITPSDPAFTSGQTESFIAQATFSDNSNQIVTSSSTWTTSNSCIVAIIGSGTNAGNATDVGTGSAVTITASYNGIVGTNTITPPSGITISPCPTQLVGSFPQVVFKAGTSTTFTASGASASVSWSSDTPGVVNFPSAGSGAANFVTAGTATITANDGANPGTLFITVQ